MMSTVATDILRCPISLQIFLNPVIIQDGNTYELDEIQKWFETKNTSPITNVVITDKTIITNFAIKSMVDNYLQLNPDKINQQYKHNDKYIKPILKSNKSKKEKRVEFSRLPKNECINCKRNVGTIFNIYQDPKQSLRFLLANVEIYQTLVR